MRAAAVIAFAFVPALAFAKHHTEWRTGYLDCGKVQVRALAECYEKTDFCISETLTFVRGGRRTVVGLHKHYQPHEVNRLKVPVLSYTADDWVCLPGASRGHYVSVLLSQTGGGNCSMCEFTQLYDLNGRLVAAGLDFNERGQPRENAGGVSLMRRLTAPSAPRAFASIYKPR